MKTNIIDTAIFATITILALAALFYATKHSYKKCAQSSMNNQQLHSCLNF